MQEKDNIIRILEETNVAIKENNPLKLKELSDQTIHTASITQDLDNIMIAIFVYSLSKILERKEYYTNSNLEEFYLTISKQINKCINSLKKDENKKLKQALINLRKKLNHFSDKMNIYIEDVFRKAQINKASKIYEHGISMEKTANLLGISLFELASYIGQKQYTQDTNLTKTVDVKSRIKLTERFFDGN
ncbi:hypothetical protein GYA25_01785 [Candidatus Woesearchaeota archaeon]|nr:hypothetical protein [Candidatus Woesearchaeota archaeon]